MLILSYLWLKSWLPEHNFLNFFRQSNSKIKVNDYLDTMFADPGPQCLLWLPLMHRMSNVENVLHPISCSFCSSESMMGFRYKCQRCPNYQLCQNCFWYGQANGSHSNDHEMKEYSTYVSYLVIVVCCCCCFFNSVLYTFFGISVFN